MFIKGNIDSVNTLLEGTDESIRSEVGEIMRIGMANRGFILSTACSISPRVPKENIQLLARIAEESGHYR
jgi:uroporphyrinogen-III decarboxylase